MAESSLWSDGRLRRRILTGGLGLLAAGAVVGSIAAFSGGGPEAVTISEGSSPEAAAVQSAVTPAGSSAEAAAMQSAVTPAGAEPLTASAETNTAWLGVAVRTTEDGLRIIFVSPDSPAAAAALQRDDIITALGGAATPTVEALKDALAAHAPGDEVDLTYLRDGVSATVSVTLGERPARLHRDEPRFSFGFFGAGAGRLVRSETTVLDADGNLVTTLTVSGTVAAISATSITVDLNGGAGNETFGIDADTRTFPQNAAVAVGDRVMVMSQDGIATRIVDSTQAAELVPEGFEGYGGFGGRFGGFDFGEFGAFSSPWRHERPPEPEAVAEGSTDQPF